MVRLISLLFLTLFCLTLLPAQVSNQASQAPVTALTKESFQVEKIAPQNFTHIADGSYLADFGRAAFATLELECVVQEIRTLSIRLGEKLLDGRIDRSPGGSIRYQDVQLELHPQQAHYLIELEPDLRNTKPEAIALPDTFPVLMPFRYAEVSGIGELEAPHLRQVAYFGRFDEEAADFSSSSQVLNQVWELCKYSIKATTFCGYYVDGDRERIPYEADAYLNQLSHYGVDDEYGMARRTIAYFMEKPTWPTEWQLHVALMFWQDYLYTGSTELIRTHFDALKHKTLMALAGENGLISTASLKHTGKLMMELGFADTTQRLRDIVDWPQAGGFGGVMGETDGFVFRPVNTVVNSFYYRNLVIMAEFARILGKTGEAKAFQKQAANVKIAFNSLLFDEEGDHYVDGMGTEHGSLHANMLPLAMGLVPEARIAGVARHIKSRGMACSVYGAQYLMEALYRAKESAYALELLTATHDRSWYNMIRSGSTITMEAWDMKYKPNADWNHAWGAAPANIIPRHLWGIRPLEPGFESVIVKPQLASLEHSTITVPTRKGQIQAAFTRPAPGVRVYTIHLPADMNGQFHLDLPLEALITLQGQKAHMKQGFLPLHAGANQVRVVEQCDIN